MFCLYLATTPFAEHRRASPPWLNKKHIRDHRTNRDNQEKIKPGPRFIITTAASDCVTFGLLSGLGLMSTPVFLFIKNPINRLRLHHLFKNLP